jgi:hypothetical protein
MGMERLLLLFGLGFLLVDVRAVVEHVQFWQRRRTALLTWPGGRPAFYHLQIGIGAALGLLIAYNVFFRFPPAEEVFGEGMMFLYYAYVVPLGSRIERGFYRDGVWTERGFYRYARIGALTWRKEKEPVLLLASASGGTARRLPVPGPLYGQVRRLLRDLIGSKTIHVSHGLRLGLMDDRDDA